MWKAQVTDYVRYFYYKLKWYQSRTLYLSLDDARTISYIHKASSGIILRNRKYYQVLVLRRIFSGDVVCEVVGTFREHDTLEFIPDISYFPELSS